MATSTPNVFQKAIGIYTDPTINGWVRGVAWVGTLALVYVAGHAIYKAIPTKEDKDAAAQAKVLDDSINNHKAAGLTQSFPNVNYSSFADGIYTSLNNLFANNYTLAIDTLKKMKNDLDVELLIKAFGNKSINHKDGKEVSLIPFVNEGLSWRWYGFFNQDKADINADWASKKITYQL